ncbi:PREDICTED: uncharacterized protein LOC109352133 isoform X2 [Lupinus angustifolius]|uniref:uncharacterized protein LOC109352133 isoform X2 n=1 Tax=Lupinus angustifolius TaxID=3871 RepID=UPI00092EEB56|nr:PREDICTED: uncharacterized protein LOC109352133 isoform X2 [Lupinus angustifolius]
MGCNTSRLDGLPVVAMCHDRCKYIDEALRQSYVLADAHVAHLNSLTTLGTVLHSFFLQYNCDSECDNDAIAINVNLDKSESSKPSPLATSTVHSESDITLHSDSEADDTEQFFNPSRYDTSPVDNVAFRNYPPPSPPPAWDFLNLFESFEKYQVPYSPPNRNIEEEKKEKEKEKGNKTGGEDGEGEKNKEGDSGVKKSISQKETTLEEHKVKSVKGLSETMKEIQILFETASGSGKQVLELLDVGKLRYHQDIAVNPACKIMQMFTPSKPLSMVNCMEFKLGSGYQGGVDVDNGLRYGNLCSTLKKLCMWEKKLYDEVKAEEKLRILHEKKCRQLRRLKKKDADAHNVDSVQTFIEILGTKIKISFQVVDKISNTICKLREEELWPQINSFIFRFHGMWKDLLECYRCQYKVIAEARSLDASSFNIKVNNYHLHEAIKLKSELQKWNLSFSDWIYAQKSHVKALNGWLLRCLMYEPEEIPDGASPFSPEKLDAPPVFVICTKWSRTMDNLSEKEVIEAANGFIVKVNKLLEKHIADLQQNLTLDKELERKVKILERQEQKMLKVVNTRQRKMEPVDTDADAVHHGQLVDTVCLQSGLKHIFAAMEKYTATTASAYEELCQLIEKNRHVLGEQNNIH